MKNNIKIKNNEINYIIIKNSSNLNIIIVIIFDFFLRYYLI